MFDIKAKRTVVTEVMPNSAAYAAKIAAGDQIVAIHWQVGGRERARARLSRRPPAAPSRARNVPSPTRGASRDQDDGLEQHEVNTTAFTAQRTTKALGEAGWPRTLKIRVDGKELDEEETPEQSAEAAAKRQARLATVLRIVHPEVCGARASRARRDPPPPSGRYGS